MGTCVVFLQKIRKEMVDGRVIEGHIIPHRLLFTSMAPTPEFPTVAWVENGIKVILLKTFVSIKSV